MAEPKATAGSAGRALRPEGGAIIKPNDPYFSGLSDELADKGFIIAAADDLITWARTGSRRSRCWRCPNSAECGVATHSGLTRCATPRARMARP